jgi:predicted peptidase
MGVPPQMMLSQVRDEAQRQGFIVAAPMGYNVRGGFGAYPRGLGNPPDSRVNDWSEQDVLNVLALMREEFMVDEQRIYVVGQSMGGAGALHLGTKYPELWAAVGATAPAVSPDEPVGLENARDLPFILVHGDSDPAVPIERSRLWAQRMSELGMTYEFYEVRRGGHSDALLNGIRYVFEFFDEHVKPAAD